MAPGALLLFWSLGSALDSVATFALTAHWTHPAASELTERLPASWQAWLIGPAVWPAVQAAGVAVGKLPLSLVLAFPGGLAVFAGLCLWEEARYEAIEERVGHSVQPRTAPQLVRRRG